jgi:anti-anti-sigma regulatory factor
VDLRLEVVAEPDRAVIRIHGRLAGAAVTELERVCREASGPLVLDLTQLMSADDAGVATLRCLRADRAQCTGISPYLALLLGSEEPQSTQ